MMMSEPSARNGGKIGTLLAYTRRSETRGSELVVYDRTRGAAEVVWSAADEDEPGASIEDVTLSADGRIVAFICAAGERGGAGLTIHPYADLHLYDSLTRRRTRFGADGELDPILATMPLMREIALSSNGEVIAFLAEKLRGFPGQADVFAFDRRAGLLSQVNPVEISPCRNVVISGDGASVFFTDAAERLHVHDLASGRTRALPITIPQASDAYYSVSADGRFVSFQSTGSGGAGEARLFDRRTGSVDGACGGSAERSAGPTARGRSKSAANSADEADLIPGRAVSLWRAADALV